MNNDGTLSVDPSTLNSAIASNSSAVLNFFQNTSGTGYANNFANDLNNLTDPTQGILNVDLTQNQSSQQDLNNSISDMQDRLNAEQQQLQTQFSQVNALLEAYPSQLLSVQLELGITPANSGNSNSIG
jgi:flagellar capping protein FliD